MTPDYHPVDGYPCRIAGSTDVGVIHSILAGSLQRDTRTHCRRVRGEGMASRWGVNLSNSPTSRGGIKGEWEMVMEIGSVSLGQCLRSQREKWVLRKQIQAVLDTVLSTGLAGRKHFILSPHSFIHPCNHSFYKYACIAKCQLHIS